jgi:plasmid stability protein
VHIDIRSGESVAQLVVCNLEEDLKVRLQRRAARHGRSLEEEIVGILRDALQDSDSQDAGLGTEISALFSRIGFESQVPEIRGHIIAPATFD